jgi:two-component system, NtrC family, nitrogen regulation sensor histidine kinase NtrY
MKLRTKYLLFVITLHGIALVLSYFILREDKLLFIISEVIILFSLWLSAQLYRELIRPLQTLIRGADAIREKDFNVKFLLTGKYEMDQLIGVYNHMMDHLRLERTKQEEQHFFLEKLIHTSPVGILVLDFDENIFQVNPKAMEILGLKENDFFGRPLHSISHPLAQEIGRLSSGEGRTVGINGIETYKIQKSHFIDRGFVRYFVIMEEVTAEILAAEKKAYGKVIRMMAHEVNNSIGPVNSILESALKTGQQGDDLENAFRVAVQRNNNLNQFMRNFADVVRLPAPDKKKFDLTGMLQNISDLMRMRAIEKKLEIEFEKREIPIFILADPQQMEQVIINILKNAMEAVGEEGLIKIFTESNPGRLIIRDNGHGISPAHEDQLFSPFFSTRPDGQGIGLTLIREILINHGFGFSLKTIQQGVTEFEIRFE